jgi:hypothetical protein
MAIQREVRQETGQEDVLTRLLHERGIDRYGLFLVSGEGRRLPGGVEATSGYVVNETGKVYFFWMDWETATNRISLTHWQEAAPDPSWLEEPEYRRALEAVGIGLNSR